MAGHQAISHNPHVEGCEALRAEQSADGIRSALLAA